MGTVNVVIGPATTTAHGPRLFNIGFRSAENITTSGTSAATTGTAQAGDVARIKAVSGACYVGKPGTAAVNAQGWYLEEGESMDFGGLRDGDTITAIEAS